MLHFNTSTSSSEKEAQVLSQFVSGVMGEASTCRGGQLPLNFGLSANCREILSENFCAELQNLKLKTTL